MNGLLEILLFEITSTCSSASGAIIPIAGAVRNRINYIYDRCAVKEDPRQDRVVRSGKTNI